MIKDKNTILNENMLSIADSEQDESQKEFIYYKKYDNELEKIRNLPIYHRLFREIKDGSLRNGVLSWLGVTWGSGVLNFPKIFSNLGLLNGIFFLLLNAYISSVCMSLYIKVSFYSKKKNLIILIEHYYGKKVANALLYIIIFMISVLITIYIVISYNFFITFLSYFNNNYFGEILDLDNSYSFNSMIWRFGFLILNYIIMYPVIIQKNFDKLKYFSLLFMAVLIYIILLVIIESPFFYLYYNNKILKSERNTYDWFYNSNYKNWMKSICTILLSFYCQTSMFSILGFIKNPTIQRCRKIKNWSILTEMLLYLFLGISGYISLGKTRQVKLIPQRDNFTFSYYDIFMRIGVLIYLFANIVASAFYSPALRSYLKITFKIDNDFKKEQKYLLINFLICSIIAFLYPNVESLFEIAGGIIGNFIGFILPIIIFYKTPKAVKSIPKIKHIRNYVILVYLCCLPLFQIISKLIFK